MDVIQNKLFVLYPETFTRLKECNKIRMSELSVIERILINMINRKQKTLYNMTS